jgi:glycosyltransferase involved in cell wall biosynthesis
MHLVVASVSAATSPSGVCRHAANIARGMLAFSSVRKVTLLTGEWQAGYFRDAFDLDDARLEILPIAIANRSTSRNLWYLRTLPALARAHDTDIVHLAYPMPVMRSAYTAPVVVSLHDLYPYDIPRNFGVHKAWLNRAVLRDCLKNVDAIACVSEPTRTRLHELFPALRPEKTSVVPNSVGLSRNCGGAGFPDAIRDSPFLLCVAQHRANKNLVLLLRSFLLALDREIVPPETKLVIVGNEGPETTHLLKLIAERNLQDRVVFLRGIPDTLLSALYAQCELVIAPSLLEGFGLPVAEALATGCRVACSDIPTFRSVATTSCVLFDPTDGSGESLVTALQNALRIPRGAESSPAGFQPQQAAAMYLALYSKLALRSPINIFQPSHADLSAPGDL